MHHSTWIAFPIAAILAAASGCSDDRTCEPVVGRKLDPMRQCYEEPVTLAGLASCWTRTEKGVTTECVAAPSGELFVVTHGITASFEGSSFRYGGALTAEEAAACQQTSRDLGPPQPANTCPAGDAGR